MYCNNCGKSIDKDSKFCRYCGTKINTDETKEDDSSEESSDVKAITDNKLWDKFAEIYDSSGDERQSYLDLSSDEVWELMNRLSNNKFEEFIKTNKESLNKQPYKVIEKLKNVFTYCATGGYMFWMAQELVKGENLKHPGKVDLDNLIDQWKVLVGKKYEEVQKLLLPETENAISRFLDYEINVVLETSDSVKELPNEAIENLRSELFLQIYWSFLSAVAEAEYRK